MAQISNTFLIKSIQCSFNSLQYPGIVLDSGGKTKIKDLSVCMGGGAYFLASIIRAMDHIFCVLHPVLRELRMTLTLVKGIQYVRILRTTTDSKS